MKNNVMFSIHLYFQIYIFFEVVEKTDWFNCLVYYKIFYFNFCFKFKKVYYKTCFIKWIKVFTQITYYFRLFIIFGLKLA